MGIKDKYGEYLAPAVKVIEIKSQGVLCQSGGQNDTFGYDDNPGWFE